MRFEIVLVECLEIPTDNYIKSVNGLQLQLNKLRTAVAIAFFFSIHKTCNVPMNYYGEIISVSVLL